MTTAPTILVGRRTDGSRVELPLDNVLRHSLVSGPTGAGKSAALIAIILGVLTRAPNVGIVLVDLKGETATELRDRFLHLPGVVRARPDLTPDRIVSIRPFGRFAVPLNPLSPIPGLDPAVQAHLVVGLLGQLLDEGLGSRMRTILTYVVDAVMALGGSLVDVRRLLDDDTFRAGVAERVESAEVRTYLSATFDREARSSKEALRARLDWLLRIRDLRQTLCADRCVTGSDLIEAPLTIVDLGDPPQGHLGLSRFTAGWLFQIITAAVFARRARSHPVLIVADEFQELLRVGHQDFERLLAQARYKRVAIHAACQTLAQVTEVSSALARSVLTNTATQLWLCPDSSDVARYDHLLPVTRRAVDPDQPDRVLSEAEERRRLVSILSRLPPRHALLVDKGGEAKLEVMQTVDLPYAEARTAGERLPAEVREAWVRGRFGVPVEALPQARIEVPAVVHRGQGDAPQRRAGLASAPDPLVPDEPVRPPASRPSSRRQRPPLVLPS